MSVAPCGNTWRATFARGTRMPARRARERPIAIACFFERRPRCRISSRTNWLARRRRRRGFFFLFAIEFLNRAAGDVSYELAAKCFVIVGAEANQRRQANGVCYQFGEMVNNQMFQHEPTISRYSSAAHLAPYDFFASHKAAIPKIKTKGKTELGEGRVSIPTPPSPTQTLKSFTMSQ